MCLLLAALFVFLAATASYGQSRPSLFTGATKAKLTTNVIPLAGKEDAPSFCDISRDDIEREARSVLGTSQITLTDTDPDITIVVEVELNYWRLDEPTDVCAGRVSVRSGVSTKVHLSYQSINTERWVNLFYLADTLITDRSGFAVNFPEFINRVMKSFVSTWANDQKR